ncbi:Uma2 family endonuclease [Fulvimarina sp. 2208YS6-2-32]|uniref:Uma2 family endonuclease n=1 Tax=Fulvimarina uroteuthidis TaxID=3098149 RepID=A0ABU5I3Z8_9HYPH|nr:Uma2 family endonuclease [Fulvimarina sp. 2208YS6-2-32]MDY8109493.1 Uma2 family endonuclease [Fulvimarina sp. 2208YS6-2-32]
MRQSPTPTDKMTADEFLVWSRGLADGERYELLDGTLLRMQAENAGHAITKTNVALSFRDALRRAGRTGCRSIADGFSIRVSDDQVREPDAMINCAPMARDDLYASCPVVVVEVLSPSTRRIDLHRKLIDYFQVPSIQHYLIVMASDRRVLLHSRSSVEGEIRTRILGEETTIALDPPGISLAIAEFFNDLPDEG